MERDGIFHRTGNLNKPLRVLLNAIRTLETSELMSGNNLEVYVSKMATKYPRMADTFCHQGLREDRLYKSSYQHIEGETCDACDSQQLVLRPQRPDQHPVVHYGNIASGDGVVKDAVFRDRIAAKENIACFEMEAAGLLDNFPCVVVRGICDYADLHKNKRWQPYAAITAAAYAKLPLSVVQNPGVESLPTASNNISSTNVFEVPFTLENIPATPRFVGREQELQSMAQMLTPDRNSPTRRTVFVVHGMGGIGKTQLVTVFARRFNKRYSAVIWINGDSRAKVHQSLLQFAHHISKDHVSEQLGQLLLASGAYADSQHPSAGVDNEMIVEEVLRWLSLPLNSRWLMIIDNVDREHEDDSLEPVEAAFANFVRLIPRSDHGVIVVTTRLRSLKTRFRNGLKLRPMTDVDARAVLDCQLLEQPHTDLSTTRSPISNKDAPDAMNALLQRLNGLPIALAQASAYIEQTGMGVSAYISHYDDKWEDLMRLQHESPLHGAKELSMFTTWMISYEQARASNDTVSGLT